MKKLKKILSAALACTMALSATVISTSAIGNNDIDTYDTAFGTAGDETNNLQNGSFEEPPLGNSAFSQMNHSKVPKWSTSATDQLIELFKENNVYLKNLVENTYLTGKALTPPDGLQAAELNAEQDSTLYQYVNTSSGSCYEWSLQHRGRCGTDTMALVIGPKQGYNPTKVSRNSRDQFMQMIDWLKNNEDKVTADKIKNQQSGDKPIECVVYSKKFAAKGTFENASDRNFSFKQTDIFSEEWHIWIIKSDNKEWHKYGKGSETAESSDYYKYIVPEGSNHSIFAFVSYQGTDAKGQSNPEKHNTFGNLLDGITFDLYHPTETIVNTGGTGKVTYIHNNSELVEDITPDSKNNPCDVMVDDNTKMDIEARPSFSVDNNGNYRTDGDGDKIPNVFLGAYVTVNGERKYLDKEEFTKETDADGDVYKYNFQNISGRISVELFFAEIYTVTYLSNGGEKYSVNDKGSGTGISALDDTPNVARFDERASGSYTAEACNWKDSDSGTVFYGWEYVNPYSDDNATIFNPDVKVTYTYDGTADPQTLNFVIEGTLVGTNQKKTITTNARSGAIFKARWYFKHDVIAQTKQSDGTYVNSSNGGYVTVNKTDDMYNLSDIGNYGKTFYSFKDKTVTAIATAKEGYRFVGWYEKTADGETYINNRTDHTYTVEDSSTTLYAKFEHDNYEIRFHINTPSVTLENPNDDIYVKYMPTYDDTGEREEIRYLNTDKTVTPFYDIPRVVGTGSQRMVFKGWYRNKANDDDSNPIVFNGTNFVEDADVYAHWIDIGTVDKAADDEKIGVSRYCGFELFGTQIRNADDDENYPVKPSSFDKSGLRFVTSFSEKLLSDIDKLDGTKTRPEYGYVIAKESTAKKAAEIAGVSDNEYEIEYNGTNVNGKDTTAKSSYGYVTNVNCTSSKSYSGIVPLDHFNSDNYRIFSLVITYKKGGSSSQSQNVIARPYIRYTDANGLYRTYYSNYTGDSKLYGGCSTSFDGVKNIIAQNYNNIKK